MVFFYMLSLMDGFFSLYIRNNAFINLRNSGQFTCFNWISSFLKRKYCTKMTKRFAKMISEKSLTLKRKILWNNFLQTEYIPWASFEQLFIGTESPTTRTNEKFQDLLKWWLLSRFQNNGLDIDLSLQVFYCYVFNRQIMLHTFKMLQTDKLLCTSAQLMGRCYLCYNVSFR